MSMAFGKELRIVSLHPTLTEILFELGLGKNVVGTTEFSDYPPEAKKIPRVGDLRVNAEKIISLKPTILVAMDHSDPSIIPTIQRAGIKTEIFESSHLSDYPKILDKMSRVFAVSGENLKNSWKSKWDRVEKSKQGISVLIQVDQNPLMVSGGDTFLSEVVDTCGVRNVASDLHGYIPLTKESLLQRKIKNVLLILETDKSIQDAQRFWEAFPEKNRPTIYKFKPDVISRLTARLPQEAKTLCDLFRPKKGLR